MSNSSLSDMRNKPPPVSPHGAPVPPPQQNTPQPAPPQPQYPTAPPHAVSPAGAGGGGIGFNPALQLTKLKKTGTTLRGDDTSPVSPPVLAPPAVPVRPASPGRAATSNPLSLSGSHSPAGSSAGGTGANSASRPLVRAKREKRLCFRFQLLLLTFV